MGKPSSLSGCFELFRRLVRRHGVPARHAEDVAQEALLRCLEADERIEPRRDPLAYHVTIALNQARNHVRDSRRRGEVLTSFDEREFPGACPTPEDLLRLREREARARQLVARVDPKYRDLLIRHDLEGTPLVEIAAELGLHVEAVKTQHRRAREELKAQRQRWTAQERSQGRDGEACVPLAFGFHGRRSWRASLRRLGLRILVQGAFVVLTGALFSGVPRLPSPESWTQAAAVGTPGTAPAAQGDVVRAARAGADAAAHEGSTATLQGSARPGATAGSAPAPAATTVPRATTRGSAVRPTVNQRERSLIEEARMAIETHTALGDVEARQLLEAHAREFPRGRLAREREALLRQIR
ncbi:MULTISPECIES: RNA polymerase sigma factor [Sorangium]|uniref:RNA polymerase sigma factor n=1 Tax=Sorangium cellulosum TaxID=56 RepID=A0A4P2QEB4_SORCE|nr:MULTISPECIES: sigma-70 family RNA polymerase sigma factor [Sorangium]AUX28157.1 RNA polymerase sigma factor [Sorangium cellulosum]WCQ87559.1 RNA polymerase sigma factor [Sorangium sp. Soce836]